MNKNDKPIPILEGTILEEQEFLSMGEICRMCRVHADYVLDLVEYGILEPVNRDPQRYHFHGECVIRIRKAMRLQSDMDINLAGVAMILDLLAEITELKSRLGQR